MADSLQIKIELNDRELFEARQRMQARQACQAEPGALGQPQRDRRVEAALGVESVQEPPESVVLHDQVLQRQLAVLEADLGQVLAAHRVIARGALETRRAALDQHTDIPIASVRQLGSSHIEIRVTGSAPTSCAGSTARTSAPR